MKPGPTVVFPRPFAVVVDDLGWLHGGSQDAEDGPYRLGFKRELRAEDYLPLIEVGKAAGVRIQGAFVLCELDRGNAAAQVPSATREGSARNNPATPEQLRIMETVKAGAAHLEFALHGAGHEHWENGRRRRGEWYNLQDRHPWREAEIRAHLDLFATIMAQYGLTPEQGHAFPESFVPCAYSYFWNPSADPYSLGSILREYGVRFANTAFAEIPHLDPPESGSGGFDHGVLVLDRHTFGNDWWEPATPPRQPIATFDTDLIESHWANWLATDDPFQPDVNAKWTAFLQRVQATEDRYLAKNTEQFHAQWLYRKYARITEPAPGRVHIDNRAMPREAYEVGLVGPLVLKLRLPEGAHLSQATLNGQPIPSLQEIEGFAHAYLPALGPEVAELSYAFGDHLPPKTVVNTGTYNVYSRSETNGSVRFKIRMYGEQDLVLTTATEPRTVASSNPALKEIEVRFDKASGTTAISLRAHDLQGETGELTFQF